MWEIEIETNENELVLYNILINMNNNSKYSKNVEENLECLISILKKNLSKNNLYIGYSIEDSVLIRVVKLKKDNICNN